jgi:hypothetical protein
MKINTHFSYFQQDKIFSISVQLFFSSTLTRKEHLDKDTIERKNRPGRMAQVIECLPGKCETGTPVPPPKKKTSKGGSLSIQVSLSKIS